MSATIQIELPRMIWAPCPTCWGQRRIFADRNGEGLVPCPCPECLGIGERIVPGADRVGGVLSPRPELRGRGEV